MLNRSNRCRLLVVLAWHARQVVGHGAANLALQHAELVGCSLGIVTMGWVDLLGWILLGLVRPQAARLHEPAGGGGTRLCRVRLWCPPALAGAGTSAQLQTLYRHHCLPFWSAAAV